MESEYGHILLDVDKKTSQKITSNINKGDLTLKPGWVRMSIHPTMTNNEVEFIVGAIEEVAKNHALWTKDYIYNSKSNEFVYKEKKYSLDNKLRAQAWFDIDLS